MDFIAQIAWPVAIIVVAVLFRRPLLDLVAAGVTRFRAGPFELAWDQAKTIIERPATAPKRVRVVPECGEPAPLSSFLGTEIVELAESAPREAILSAYETVRRALANALLEAGLEVETEGLDALALVREAESNDVTPPQVTDAVMGLNVLHNIALHAPSHEPSPARAREYIAMTDGALFALTSALKKHLASSSAARAS